MTDLPSLPLESRLRALTGYLQQLESPGFEFGQWERAKRAEPGVTTLPNNILGSVASSLVKAAYDNAWVLRDFDWGAWKATQEACQLRDDPAVLDRATPEQLAKLLTVLIRQDRFVDGALQGAFESGLLVKILRRVEVLHADVLNSNKAI